MSPTLAQVWKILTSHFKGITHSWKTWTSKMMRNQKNEQRSCSNKNVRLQSPQMRLHESINIFLFSKVVSNQMK